VKRAVCGVARKYVRLIKNREAGLCVYSLALSVTAQKASLMQVLFDAALL
jgi:hypothetical protein